MNDNIDFGGGGQLPKEEKEKKCRKRNIDKTLLRYRISIAGN
jgi:hypothetical protein